MYKSFLNQKKLTKGLRNNNPGNFVITTIPWKGKIAVANNTDGHFEQFVELRYGIRAMMRHISTNVAKGKSTISMLISTYAPAFENNTVAYINSIANMVGIGIDQKIEAVSKAILIGLCKAIILVENGKENASLVTEKDYEDAYEIADLGGVVVKKKAI